LTTGNQSEPLSQPSISQESNSGMKSIDEMSEAEIEKLARAIIHQAVEESKLCSFPADKIRSLQEAQYKASTESYNSRTLIVQKNVVTHWIH